MLFFNKAEADKYQLVKIQCTSSFIRTFNNAEILIEIFEDVNIEIWTKYIFIASFALITATYNKTIGEVASDEQLGIIVKNIMREIALIANALKIALPSDIVETSFSKAKQFPFETNGRQREWDLFSGTLTRYAERFNIPASNTKETLDKLLQNLSQILHAYKGIKFVTKLIQPMQINTRLVSSVCIPLRGPLCV